MKYDDLTLDQMENKKMAITNGVLTIKEKDEFLSKMKNAADRLYKILDDPHPGLILWCVILDGCLNEIYQLYDKGGRGYRL